MDDLFFWLSKMFWVVSSPDHLLLFLFSFAVLLSAPGNRADVSTHQRRGRRLLWVTLSLTWVIAVYPVGNILLLPLERQFVKPPMPAQEQLAGVIVLGGAERLRSSEEWNGLETNEAAERVLAMVKLLHHYPKTEFIYTGGSGALHNQGVRGADLVEAYLADMGLSKQVKFERDSRNTYENAVFSKSLMKQSKSTKWLLVTSAFHMPRAVGVFRRQGIDVLPYPVDYRSSAKATIHFALANNFKELKGAVREWIGLLAYWLTGKTMSLFPKPLPALVIYPDS